MTADRNTLRPAAALKRRQRLPRARSLATRESAFVKRWRLRHQRPLPFDRHAGEFLEAFSESTRAANGLAEKIEQQAGRASAFARACAQMREDTRKVSDLMRSWNEGGAHGR